MTRLLFLASAGIVAVSLAVTAAPAAYAADRSDTVRYSRATLRDAPARLVLANVLPGDRIMRQVQCGGWVRVAVRPSAGRSLATTTGWVERGSLKKSARRGGLAGIPSDCAARRRDVGRWRSFVAAINSPFHSYRYDDRTGNWRYVHFPTRVAALTGRDCVPSFNYLRTAGGEHPDAAQPIPADVDLTRPGYRYLTRSGTVALVSLPRANGRDGSVWGFVKATCVKPLAGRYPTTVYFPTVVQLDRIPPGHPPLSTDQLAMYGCHAAVSSPTYPMFGWWPDPQAAPACRH